MTISEILIKMINYSNANLHDINHLVKVHSYAKLIADGENLSPSEKRIVEVAAIIHDIACPLCREKYGHTDGPYQEKEGMVLSREFLSDVGLTQDELERVVYLVGHHHTLNTIEGVDYQILIEADYLVNANELNYSKANIQNMCNKVFKTPTGIALIKSIYEV